MDKSCGGLRLFNLKYEEQALKIQWVKIYHTGQEVKKLANCFIKHGINNYIWTENLCKKDIALYFHKSFWKDVASCWFSFTFVKPTTRVSILEQKLWLNLCVKLDDMCLFNKQAIEHGLTLVKQIISEDGIFLSYEAINA